VDVVLGALIAAIAGLLAAAVESRRDSKRYEREVADREREAGAVQRADRISRGSAVLGELGALITDASPSLMIHLSRPGEPRLRLDDLEGRFKELRPRLLAFGIGHPSKDIREATTVLDGSIIFLVDELKNVEAHMTERGGLPEGIEKDAHRAWTQLHDEAAALATSLHATEATA
jgi:hypothetical protein